MNDMTREAIRPDRAITDPMNLKDPGIKGALVPATASEAMEMAKMICSGKFAVPNYLHNNPGDCLRIVLVAARSGLDPFMLANESYLTESKKTGEKRMEFMAKAVHAIVLASGVLQGDLGTKVEGQGANLSCTVTGQRRGGRTHTETYYMAPIHPKNSPLWQSQPRQQLIYYAERSWCRAHAPDALMGLVAREDPMIDVTPLAVSVNGDPPRGPLAEVEAHLGVGDEPKDEETTETPSGGSADDEVFAMSLEERLAWLKETSLNKAANKEDLDKWLAEELTEKVVGTLTDDKHAAWITHINGVIVGLDASA